MHGCWGFLFLKQFGCVSPEIGWSNIYELTGQRWMEGKIDWSSSGTGLGECMGRRMWHLQKRIVF